MKKQIKLAKLSALAVLVLSLSLTACESRTDKVDGGGVLLSISDFDGLPAQVSVNNATATGLVQIGEVIIDNIPKNANAPTSALQNVEIDSYEVVFTRADTGTRVPPVLVRQIFSVAPVNAGVTLENLPVLSFEQLSTTPLTDLLFVNGGFDSETGGQTILLNLGLRFFGRTLSGDEVDTQVAGFTVEFTQ